MSWGTVTVGRTALRENYNASYRVNMNTGEQTVTLTGVEWADGVVSPTMVRARREAIMSVQGAIVPVTFSVKSDHDGFYRVVDAGVEHVKWPEADHFTWSLGLSRVGSETAVDIESRLTGVARLNDFTLPGERWHSPSIGHTGYDTGSTVPTGAVARTGSEGVVTTYRGIPANVDPRWSANPVVFRAGRVRVSVDGVERTGMGFKTSGTWELHNTLVRVTPLSSNGVLSIAAYDTGVWESKSWNVQVGTNLTGFDEMTIIRNDFEAVTLRLYRAMSPFGRTYIDLTLRRGSRFVEGYIQTSTSATLGLSLNTTEASTGATGYVSANADDAAGNRVIVGSAKTFTANTNGGLSKASTRTLDFFAGVILGGGTPAAGDGATALRDQYIGALAESTMVVKR